MDAKQKQISGHRTAVFRPDIGNQSPAQLKESQCTTLNIYKVYSETLFVTLDNW